VFAVAVSWILSELHTNVERSIQITRSCMRYKILMAVTMSMLVFCVVTSCEFVDWHHRFGEP
jgi:hypothetical protein